MCLTACWSSTHEASLVMVLFESCNDGGSTSLLVSISMTLETWSWAAAAGYGGCWKS
jgi:hypothetical protein